MSNRQQNSIPVPTEAQEQEALFLGSMGYVHSPRIKALVSHSKRGQTEHQQRCSLAPSRT